MRKLIFSLAVCSALAACEKPTAKFRPGDKVKVKLTDTTGVIAQRLSPFVEDLYYVKAPGKQSAMDPDNWFLWGPNEPNWHYEGPYRDSELVLLP
jgi:hypothetical protein